MTDTTATTVRTVHSASTFVQLDPNAPDAYITFASFAVRSLSECLDARLGYRVKVAGPVLTTTGKRDATQTRLWSYEEGEVPEPLRRHLIGREALAAELRRSLDAMLGGSE